MNEERITPLSTEGGGAEEQPKEVGKEGPKEGVLVRSNSENIKPHRFLPGQSGNPGGRIKRPETQVLKLIHEKVDPQLVVDTILDLLSDKSSWRPREAGVKLYLSYMVGMPVQRSITASTKLESILDKVRDMDEGEFGQVIDAMKQSD